MRRWARTLKIVNKMFVLLCKPDAISVSAHISGSGCPRQPPEFPE